MFPAGMRSLIALNEPYWGGEAEVIRSYWRSDIRTRQTDRLWLARQAYKEYWGGFVPALRRLSGALGAGAIDRDLDRSAALDLADKLRDELAHYVAFADAHDALLDPGEPVLDPGRLEHEGDWPENEKLSALRAEHIRQHGEIGLRARHFTEGGCCTLYAEGMALRGGGRVDDLIAAACALVHDDEVDHMLEGARELESLDDEQWALMRRLTVEQLQARISMRNAQFSHPLGPDRIAELCAGRGAPRAFDYARARRTERRPV